MVTQVMHDQVNWSTGTGPTASLITLGPVLKALFVLLDFKHLTARSVSHIKLADETTLALIVKVTPKQTFLSKATEICFISKK